MAAYLADKKETARSYNSMLTAWRALRPTFENLRPDQITRPLCRLYAKSRRKNGVSNGTIIKDLGVLKAALGWAKRDREATFEMPPTPPPRERFLTRDEYEKLLKACEHAHLELFIILGVTTAGRASALFELTWNRVDFDRGLIRLSAGHSGQKGRATVPMNKRARAALETAYKGRTTDYVIEWGGKPVKSLKRSFERACARAGVEGVSPHILRHTAAVWMAQEGVDLFKISKFLGHTDPRITARVYAKFAPDFMGDAAAALE